MDLIEAGKNLPDLLGRLLVELGMGDALVQAFLFGFQLPDSPGQLLELPLLIVGELFSQT